MRLLVLPAIVLLAWGLICGWYYVRQESVIFQPSVLPDDHVFRFERPFEEHWIEVEPGVELNALLFPAFPTAAAESSRPAGVDSSHPAAAESSHPAGAVFYLHGNAGDLQGWGDHAGLYVDAGYDFFVVDYRGYGKSDGRNESEPQLHADVQRMWDWLAARYAPDDITVIGYSLGSPLAARVACDNGARRLVLFAPFYSARDVARRMVPFVPIRLLRYPLRTDLALTECRLPVTMFHGVNDGTIPIESSRRLLDLLGERGRLVSLPGTGHQDVPESPMFQREMRELLASAPEP